MPLLKYYWLCLNFNIIIAFTIKKNKRLIFVFDVNYNNISVRK